MRGHSGPADEGPPALAAVGVDGVGIAVVGVTAPDAVADTLPAACAVGVEDAAAAPSEAGRLHAVAAAQMSRKTRDKVVIEL